MSAAKKEKKKKEKIDSHLKYQKCFRGFVGHRFQQE